MQYTQEAASIDPSERARDGLRSCQHHAAALLAPAYMRWQVNIYSSRAPVFANVHTAPISWLSRLVQRWPWCLLQLNVMTSFKQGGSFEAGETDWSQIAAWLRALGDSVLLCFENAEEPLRTSSVAQVSEQGS